METDKPVYAMGEEVAITVRATNTSDHDCPSDGLSAVRTLTASGELVSGGGTVADYPQGSRWQPGGTTQDPYVRWDQRCHQGGCEGVQQPPGDYTIEATWRGYGSARTTIRIG